MIDNSLVSVIIPTFNSIRTIDCCLQSVTKQTYQNIEIIVVDSNSNDGTRELAKTFDAKVIEEKVGRSKARNIGAEKSKGAMILFLDSDMELTPRVVEECVKKVQERYDAVIIPELSVGDGFWTNCKTLEKICYISDDLIEASRFFQRNIFENVDGYDSELEFGEDWDLNQRIRNSGYRIGRINAYIYHHEGRLSLWKTIMKKYHYGKTLEKYKRKHPNETKRQLKFFRPAFVRNWRLLLRDPIHAFGMLLMKSCEFGAVELGYYSQKRSYG
jgi:glycosyltransferase involved in cell wall biosynthesis